MGVFSVFRRFIIFFYLTFMWVILLVNLSQFAGLNLFANYISDTADWDYYQFDNSYLGFSSVINFFKDCPENLFVSNCFQIFDFLIDGFSQFNNAWVEYMPDSVAGIGVTELLKGIIFVIDMWFIPIRLLVSFIWSLGLIIADIFRFAVWIAKLLGGFYNIPLRTM